MPFRSRYTGLIDKYRDRLPVHDDTRIISLGEGNTPLIRLHNIPRELGKDVDIYVKYEGLNPTGSFKDRGMTMAVTKAVEEGSRRSSAPPPATPRPRPRLRGACRDHRLRADPGRQDRAG
jgi:threonine synthase